MAQQSTLDDLLVEEDDLNESLLTDVLSPYIGIGDESGAFLPNEKFESLNSTKQAAIVLLYKKAAYELDLSEEEGAGPMAIADASGMNHSTAKTAVRSLDEKNLVENNNGEYTVPPYNYDSVRRLIEGDGDEQ